MNMLTPRKLTVTPIRRLIDRMFYKLGYVRQERLSSAAGALSDIKSIVTSCVGKTDPDRTHEISQSVLYRILSSSHAVHNPPSWYKHLWEQRLWDLYLNENISACAYEEPSISVGRKLSIERKKS